MPNEGQATAADATTTTGAVVAATTEAPESYVGADGVFVEDWQSKLQDESLHDDQTLKTIKNVENLAKSYVHVRKQVPLDKIAIPTETSSEAVWDAYYAAGGRPSTAEEYVMEVPEEHADYFSEELITEAKGIFHSLGFNQKQVDALWEFEKKRVAATEKSLDDFDAQEKAEAETALRNKWGAAYDENLHLVNRMISENAVEGEERDYLLAEYGNDPKLAGFLGNIAKKFIEHKIITNVETPSADMESKIKELMDSPAYKDPRFADKAEHKRVVAQVYALREQLLRMKK